MPEGTKKTVISNPLQMYLQKEIQTRLQKQELPSDWGLIKTVKYKFQSEKSNQSLGNLPIMQTNPQGILRLDVTFMDEPGSESIILVQFNVINMKTNNLVYEFFLRIDLSQLKS